MTAFRIPEQTFSLEDGEALLGLSLVGAVTLYTELRPAGLGEADLIMARRDIRQAFRLRFTTVEGRLAPMTFRFRKSEFSDELIWAWVNILWHRHEWTAGEMAQTFDLDMDATRARMCAAPNEGADV